MEKPVGNITTILINFFADTSGHYQDVWRIANNPPSWWVKKQAKRVIRWGAGAGCQKNINFIAMALYATKARLKAIEWQ